eukprot:14515382-Alexandrium_andersonii.AAC.1
MPYEGSHRLAGLGARSLPSDLRLPRRRPPGRAVEARPRGGYRGLVVARRRARGRPRQRR